MKTSIYRLTAHPMRLLAATLVLAVAGGVALSANAGPQHGRHGMGMGESMGMMMAGPGGLHHLLDEVKASDEQRSQIKAIFEAARHDLKAQHEAGRALRAQSLALFTQPTVDAVAAENVRLQMMALHDHASRRWLQAMLDVSAVLTPPQRQQIGQRISERQAAMQRRMAERQAQHDARSPAAPR